MSSITENYSEDFIKRLIERYEKEEEDIQLTDLLNELAKCDETIIDKSPIFNLYNFSQNDIFDLFNIGKLYYSEDKNSGVYIDGIKTNTLENLKKYLINLYKLFNLLDSIKNFTIKENNLDFGYFENN